MECKAVDWTNSSQGREKVACCFKAQLWVLGFHKIRIIFLPAEDILAAQEGPCPVELFIIIIIIIIIIIKIVCFNRYT